MDFSKIISSEERRVVGSDSAVIGIVTCPVEGISKTTDAERFLVQRRIRVIEIVVLHCGSNVTEEEEKKIIFEKAKK